MPADKCTRCGKFFSAAGDGARCATCSTLYHKQCLNLSPNTKLTGKWQCKTCIIKKNTVQAANDNVGSVYSGQTVDDGCSVQAGSTPSLVQELQLLRHEISGLRHEMARLTNMVDSLDKRIESVENRVCSLECQASEQKSQNAGDVVTQVNELKKQLNESEQLHLLNDLEISGVPESSNENPTHVIITLSQKLGIVLEDRDVVSAYRAGAVRRNHAGDNDDEAEPVRAGPRVLVARLARRSLRDDILRAARVRRGADTSGTDICSGGQPRRFFVNERLTRINRHLFYLARKKGSENNWNFVWTRGGYIYARRDSKSKICKIRSQDELNQVFGFASN